jgi:hypothetical protein
LLTRSPSYSSSIPLPHCGPRGSFLPSLSHPEPSALPWTGCKSPPSGLSCLLTLLFANAAPAGVPALNGTANMPALGQPSAKGPGGAQSSQLCPSQSTQAAGGVPNWPSPPASEGQMLWERSACWYCSMKVDPPCLPTIRVAALIRCLSKPWMRAGGGARVRVIHLFFPFLFFFFFLFFFNRGSLGSVTNKEVSVTIRETKLNSQMAGFRASLDACCHSEGNRRCSWGLNPPPYHHTHTVGFASSGSALPPPFQCGL